MFRRNRGPPLPPNRQNPNSKPFLSPTINRNSIVSPPNTLTKLERKPSAEAKPSSLNNKLNNRVFQGIKQGNTVNAPYHRQPNYQVNVDYFPTAKSQQLLFSSSTSTSLEEGRNQNIKSAPILPLDLDEKKDRDSVSTELSKRESWELKSSLKEVKFGEVIEEPQKLFIKKKDKVRSPSILKNGKNVLNSSIVSAEVFITLQKRQRSCSVVSLKKENEKEKYQNNVNHTIKQKYKNILSKLQSNYHGKQYRSNRFSGSTYTTNSATYHTEKTEVPDQFKYKDQIFPPVYSSLFATRKNRPKIGSEIQWIRLPQLFDGCKIVLNRPFQTDIQIFRDMASYSEEYFPGTMNSLLGCPSLLQKIFEDQTINMFGIYLIKIYQEHTWKYIIVDDYIPTIKDEKGKSIPAFTSVRSKDTIDIWPFLLEKAYANYYSSYQALQYGNMIDFCQELCGAPSQKIIIRRDKFKNKKNSVSNDEEDKALKLITKKIKNGNTVIIGEIVGDKGYAPIVYSMSRGDLNWHDPFCEFKRRKISFEYLKDTFRSIYLISPLKASDQTRICLKRSRAPIKNKLSPGIYQQQNPSARSFILSEGGQYSISVKQRDSRFFHFKQNYGNYIWIRAILLQKQTGEIGYRWISGEYSNKKSINFINFLDPGEYLLLIEPEWQANSPNQLYINCSGPSQVQLTRQLFNQEQRIIEKGCLDLAQRKGDLNQINKFICSYNYISEKVGFIIQNIVNERVSGNVSVIRSIRGLKCKSEILPVNYEFYQKIKTSNGDILLQLNEEIELDIPEGQNYTVVLKMKGGLDSKFFRTFDFGC